MYLMQDRMAPHLRTPLYLSVNLGSYYGKEKKKVEKDQTDSLSFAFANLNMLNVRIET